MSHEIIRRIDIRDGKVYMKVESNNCWPHRWDEHEEPYFTKLYQEKGQEGLDRYFIHSLLWCGTKFKGTEKGMARYRKVFESERGMEIRRRYSKRIDEEYFGRMTFKPATEEYREALRNSIEDEATEGLMALLGY